MKIWKKNLVAAGILVTVCCGIYLNWTAGGGKDTMDLEETLHSEKLMNDSLLVMGDQAEQLPQEENTVTDYFAAVRLSRQKARDSAVRQSSDIRATYILSTMLYSDCTSNSEALKIGSGMRP